MDTTDRRTLRIEPEDEMEGDDDLGEPTAFAGQEEGDPRCFDWEPGGSRLNTDMSVPPVALSSDRAWVQEVPVKGKESVWKLIVLDTDDRRWVTIRTAKTEAEIDRFGALLGLGYHPNALPRHIH